MNVLRPSLLPGLLDSLRHNFSRRNDSVALFEIGRVFRRGEKGEAVETRRLAIALCGRRNPVFWSGADRDAAFDAHDLKGMLEEFLDRFGARGVQFANATETDRLLIQSGEIRMGRDAIGRLGLMDPRLARDHDIRESVFLAEMDLDVLVQRRASGGSFKPLPQYPGMRRDVAMVVAEGVSHADVLASVKKARPDHLESVDLFDVFRGRNVPSGCKSVAYALTYRSPERTLTDKEVTDVHSRVLAGFGKDLNAVPRE